MSRDFSNDDFKKNINQFYKKVSQELRSKFDRNLPFQDAVFDRWERAKELNFGINTSIYNSSLVYGNVKVGDNSWIGPNSLVNCNIPKRSIFAGTPAKQIGIVKILKNKIFLEYFNKD